MMNRTYNVELVMDPAWERWHYNAKNRITDNPTTGATDFTDGNIDYTFTLHSWKGRTIYGEIILKIPKPYRTLGGYIKDYSSQGADWLKAAAKDAVREELRLSYGQEFQRLIRKVRVTLEYKRRT